MVRPVEGAVTTRGARAVLLGGLIDHAALFPPASLGLEEALAEDERVRRAPGSWLVGRFVCPASRLVDLDDADVRLTVVLDDPAALLDDPRVEAVELPPGVPPDVALPVDEVYVERPLGELGWLDDVAGLGRRAKVRCGGAVVPTVDELAAFVARCRLRGVPFKATAGLHHPVSGPGRHGFLNLLAAAVFGDEEAALQETDASAFTLDDVRFGWRGRESGPDELARVRRELFVAFGSCSVAEPVEDLRALGLL
jgi:hypothetical protein